MKQIHEFCPLCSTLNIIRLGKYHLAEGLMKCADCGFIFIEKIPSETELNKYYSSYSYNREVYLSPLTVKSYNRLLDEFQKYRFHNTLLDVGCGRGWFLGEAKKRGWEVYGTEYSESALELCKSKGINVRKGELKAVDFDSLQFDVVTSFEVIEHLCYPGNHVQEIEKLLRPGGLFYCTTPNYNSLQRYLKKEKYKMISYPEHLSCFTKETLCRLAGKHGLKKEKFLCTGFSLDMMIKPEKRPNVTVNSPHHPDEKLRKKIERNTLMKIIKNLLNFFLTSTSTGITLKGYFVKENDR